MRDDLFEVALKYVQENIKDFHNQRFESLNTLKFNTVLKRKNPYLFKAKSNLSADKIVKNILDAHLSSNEETLFGNWLEGLAIFINEKVYSGRKSGINGIDLEFDNDGIRYIVAIKSGPNWGNSSQIKKMILDFKTAKVTLRTSNSKLNVVAVNGCCYGINNKPDKGDYYKYCGQEFWEFISGNSELYLKIIEYISYKSEEYIKLFDDKYPVILEKFINEFKASYCDDDKVDWDKIVKLNSGKKVKVNKKANKSRSS
jgi:hypothetical protein